MDGASVLSPRSDLLSANNGLISTSTPGATSVPACCNQPVCNLTIAARAVAAVSAEEMGDGALPGVVQEVIFQGSHALVRLLVGAQGAAAVEVFVKRPAGAPPRGFGVGETISIAWQGDHATAFEPEAGS